MKKIVGAGLFILAFGTPHVNAGFWHFMKQIARHPTRIITAPLHFVENKIVEPTAHTIENEALEPALNGINDHAIKPFFRGFKDESERIAETAGRLAPTAILGTLPTGIVLPEVPVERTTLASLAPMMAHAIGRTAEDITWQGRGPQALPRGYRGYLPEREAAAPSTYRRTELLSMAPHHIPQSVLHGNYYGRSYRRPAPDDQKEPGLAVEQEGLGTMFLRGLNQALNHQ